VSDDRLIQLLRERGVNFSLTPDYRDELKSYNVDGTVLEAIASAKRR
jgi:hypothetical protein